MFRFLHSFQTERCSEKKLAEDLSSPHPIGEGNLRASVSTRRGGEGTPHTWVPNTQLSPSLQSGSTSLLCISANQGWVLPAAEGRGWSPSAHAWAPMEVTRNSTSRESVLGRKKNLPPSSPSRFPQSLKEWTPLTSVAIATFITQGAVLAGAFHSHIEQPRAGAGGGLHATTHLHHIPEPHI